MSCCNTQSTTRWIHAFTAAGDELVPIDLSKEQSTRDRRLVALSLQFEYLFLQVLKGVVDARKGFLALQLPNPEYLLEESSLHEILRTFMQVHSAHEEHLQSGKGERHRVQHPQLMDVCKRA